MFMKGCGASGGGLGGPRGVHEELWSIYRGVEDPRGVHEGLCCIYGLCGYFVNSGGCLLGFWGGS